MGQLFFIFSLPGVFFGNYVKENHSECKRIAFGRISEVTERFGRHVERTTNQIVLGDFLIS